MRKKIIIKPSSYMDKISGQKQPGFDFDRGVMDVLVEKGIATTTDCCTYTPVGGEGGDGANLSMTRNATTVTIASDTGTDAVIPAADGTNAGLMVPAQFTKLSNVTVTQAVDLDAMETDVADLTTLSGVASNATNLGTFTGTTIPDNQTNKAALQALETAVEGKNTNIQFQEEGSNLGTAGTVTTVNFVGSAVTASRSSNTVTVTVSDSAITTSQITPTGTVEAGNMIVRYIGTTPPTLAVTPGTWTLNMAGSELLSADIYMQDGDNPGANLTLNINSTSSVKNQDITTLYVPHVFGVNLGAGAGSLPADYNATTGATNLLTRVNTTPSNGDVQLLLQNFQSAFGTGAFLLKLLW